MSIRLEMLQVARCAPKVLGDSTELVQKYLLSQIRPEGAFADRSGQPDLYYTVFGLEALAALQAEIPRSKIEVRLEAIGEGPDLDFVHLCCLARCRADLNLPAGPNLGAAIAANVFRFRRPDGGFNPDLNASHSTVYGNFLALGACQDLELPLPATLSLVQSLKFLETKDGGWANAPGLNVGSANATAAAVTLLRNLDFPVNSAAGDFLLTCVHPEGGFRAAPNAPMPDLLSTATALHALAALERDLSPVAEPCLDFIDSLWTNEGGFHGHWADDFLDVEYTYYGLLALGHLSFFV